MIFRTAVRHTSYKLGPKGLYPEEMFENDVNEKHSFDRAIRDSYFMSLKSLQWPYNVNLL